MKVLEDFEEAVREHAFRGAAHPQDQADIEREYQITKQKILEVLKRAHKHTKELK